MTYLSIPLLMAAVSVSLREAKGTLAPTWSYCECRWELWRAWSNCTSDCFGRRVRTRSVLLKQQPGCAEFEDCATPAEGREWQGCNEICHNSGNPTGLAWSPCTCQAGYYSNCCTERVNCGNLDSIQNGAVSVTSTYYGGTATYTCNTHYNLTGGNPYRTCNNNFAWSGSEPRCIFVNHCGSAPCRNGATCIDLLDDFRCYCARGLSGRHCENDIQPPVMEDCSRDIRINATDNTVNVSWVPPKFTDPFGSKLDIVSNYPTSLFSFPWGDHTVQYVATKPNNGLVTECTFTIKVRPTPCDELNIPLNGARLCNGWQTDYGRFCFVTCQQNYMLSPAYSFNSWHVCGASGSWRTAGPIPDCDVVVESIAEAENYHPEYANYTYTSSCDNISTKSYLQSLYIEQLKKSGFTMFCTRFSTECEQQNVDVHCSS